MSLKYGLFILFIIEFLLLLIIYNKSYLELFSALIFYYFIGYILLLSPLSNSRSSINFHICRGIFIIISYFYDRKRSVLFYIISYNALYIMCFYFLWQHLYIIFAILYSAIIMCKALILAICYFISKDTSFVEYMDK